MKKLAKILIFSIAAYGIAKAAKEMVSEEVIENTKKTVTDKVTNASGKVGDRLVKTVANEIFKRNPKIVGNFDPQSHLYSFEVTFGGESNEEKVVAGQD